MRIAKIWDDIGKCYQASLDEKRKEIDEKIDLKTVTDALTASLITITIRDWCDSLLVFDGVILDVNDIKKLTEAEKKI